MATIYSEVTKTFSTCSCCREKVKPFNRILQVYEKTQSHPKKRKGERYCLDCGKDGYIKLNNNDIEGEVVII